MSPIFDRDGKLTHYVDVQDDVTARVAFEEALRESERLAATGRLATSVAHGINSPLEAVTNLLYLAERRPDAKQKDEYVRQASEELHHVSEITTQSLRFYCQSSKPRAVRTVDIVTGVLDVFSVRMTSWNIVVGKQTQGSVVCLESEIREVMSNLIRNAMDAMRGLGGELIVRVWNAACWSNDGRGISITVADSGTGMSQKTGKKLSRAFYKTKENHGTELGLWPSQEIIARHHGKLVCRSTQATGRSGTVFTLFIPFQAITSDEAKIPK